MNGSSSKSKIPDSQSYPYLMISHGRKSRFTCFYSILEDKDYTAKIPQLSDKNVCTSCDGWVVTMDSDTRECVLLNLGSMESIKPPDFFNSYPPPTSNSNSNSSTNNKIEWVDKYINGVCILTEPPTAFSCILGFFTNQGHNALIWRPGQANWVEYGYGYKLYHLTVCNKKIYGIVYSESNDFVPCEIEIVDEKFTVRRLGTICHASQPGVSKFFHYLVGSCEDIFYVQISTLGFTTNRIRYIDVYKFEETNSKWIKVKNIGDRVFFIDQSSQAISTNSQLKGNLIYFTKNREDQSLYYYDMKENRVGVLPPSEAVLKRRSSAHFIMIRRA